MSGGPTHGILRKTARGRAVLQGTSFPGTWAQRQLLVMLDGRRSLAALAPIIESLGLKEDQVRDLVALGLAEWVVAPPPVPKKPGAPRPRPRSLHLAKIYALELAILMAPDHEPSLRDAVRTVHDEPSLWSWMQLARACVARQAGEARAALFWSQVQAQLPEGLRAPDGCGTQDARPPSGAEQVSQTFITATERTLR
ncbi:hypothetical protein [Caldimonas manganoxidans]|uniref:hypothetical protein n=1 Tax=Caldimonas manganoxidans TaxID=196015 RepID=UPI000369A135|nr:hypothetical protein [Caldimonas manganoxidans]